jgi:hypothetical protein
MRSATLAFVLFVTGLLGLTSGQLHSQSQLFEARPAILGPRVFPTTTVVLDADLDGQKDLVLGNGFPLDIERRPAHVYCLDAQLRLGRQETIPPTEELGIVSYPALMRVDLDEDRFEDIVSVSTVGGVTVHRNRGIDWDGLNATRFETQAGMQRFSSMGPVSAPMPFHGFSCTAIETADFNGDGHVDLAFCGEVRVLFEVVSTLGVTIMAGDGTCTLGNENRVMPGRFLDMRAVDVNHDGRVDLIALNDAGQLAIGINRGGLRFAVRYVDLPGIDNRYRLCVADLDGDGHQDYLASGLTNTQCVVIWMRGDASGNPGAAQLIEVGPRIHHEIEDMVVEDFQHDGHPDLALLLSSDDEEAQLVYFDGVTLPLGKPVQLPLHARISRSMTPYVLRALKCEDLDGDRNMDLLVTSAKCSVTDTVGFWAFRNTTPRCYGHEFKGIATLGGDGTPPVMGLLGGAPVLGNQDFALTVQGMPPERVGFLIFGPHWWNCSFQGVQLHTFPSFCIPFVTEAVHGNGFGLIPLRIPSNHYMCGPNWTFQVIAPDPQAPNPLRLAASRALAMKFSPY